MNFFLLRWAFVGLVLVTAWETRAQSLINLDFGGNTVTTRLGQAGTGLGTNDLWNVYSHYSPRYTPGMRPVPEGRLEALKYADGAASHVAVAVTNAPGVWSNASGDPMFDSFLFAPNGARLTVTVSGLEPGRYHFLLYGHADADVSPEHNSVFSLRTEGLTPLALGPMTSAGAAGWKAGAGREGGRQYVVFRDVAVGTNEWVRIDVDPGAGGVAVLNGLQIHSRGTAPPRTDQSVTPVVTDAVTNLLFREIQYDGAVGREGGRFQVSVEVESRSTNALIATVFESDIAVLAPK